MCATVAALFLSAAAVSMHPKQPNIFEMTKEDALRDQFWKTQGEGIRMGATRKVIEGGSGGLVPAVTTNGGIARGGGVERVRNAIKAYEAFQQW